jgi:hypothetical protein
MSDDQNETAEATVEGQEVKEEPLEDTEIDDPSSGLVKSEEASGFVEIKETDDEEREIIDEGKADQNDELDHVDGEIKGGTESEPFFDDDGVVWDYYENDVLSGRGAWVNAHRVRLMEFLKLDRSNLSSHTFLFRATRNFALGVFHVNQSSTLGTMLLSDA